MKSRKINAVLGGIAMAMALTSASVSAQTDVAASFYQAFNTSTSGNGIRQTVSNSPGGMLEFRHIQRPLVGYEVTYSLNPEDQTTEPLSGSCGFYCSLPPEPVSTKNHEVSVDWVVSKKVAGIRPFAVGGIGFLVTVPGTYPQFDLNTVVRIAYVYGAGMDWDVAPHFGVRLQYRGSVYKSPNVSADFPTTGRFAQTMKPMAGVYFRL